MKRILTIHGFLILMLFVSELSMAQHDHAIPKRSARKAYSEARTHLYARNYDKAIEYADKAIDKDETFTEAYWLKATILETRRLYDEQIEVLRQAAKPDMPLFEQTLLKLGSAQFSEGKYSEALSTFGQLSQLTYINRPLIEHALEEMVKCRYALSLVANPVEYEPENLGDSLNTPFDDYWPVISADENRLIITVLVAERQRDGRYFYQEDFYESYRTEEGWSKSVAMQPPLNSPQNEGAQSLSPDGKVLFFSACNRREGSGKCDIFVSVHTANGWSKPINPGSPLNTSAWEAHPSLSSDGKTLYFCSDRPGSLGKRDIWKASIEITDQYEVIIRDVVNAGSTINTIEDEVSPYIHFDNQTLYFSSDGHMGLGKHDIFMSRKDGEGNWQKPENLGYPINTHRDEIGFTVNALGTRAYFSSEVDVEGRTDKDIYSIPLPAAMQPFPVTYLEGTIYNALNYDPLKAYFELIDLQDGAVVSGAYSDEDSGKFLICLPAGIDYALNVSKEGFLFYSDRFTLTETNDFSVPFKKNIPLEPIRVGTTIELKNIYFEFDSYDLKKESFAEINKLYTLLMENPGMTVEIGGHTDGKGSEEYNSVLSLNRANAVRLRLLEKGVGAQRVSVKGYGFSQPLFPDLPHDGRNRRTEMKVTGF
jgi:outer membrane protein OmpA-like peptidoglycan-associated protein